MPVVQHRNGIRVNGTGNLRRAEAPSGVAAHRHRENGFALGGAPADLQQLLNITPTNGFDWQHVNAINRDLPLKAIVDPVTQLEIAQAERLLRTSRGQFSGAYILGGGYGYYVPEQAAGEQSAPLAEQPPPEAQESAEAAQPRVIVLQQKADKNDAQTSTPPTLPDQGPLTLVLRDGRKIEAIAFTRVSGKIVYITPGGNRATIDAADLDSAATVRLNQQNGTQLQLPTDSASF